MRILVVNDDGIKAPGIKRLVQMAAGLGEVWVVAPAAQCSYHYLFLHFPLLMLHRFSLLQSHSM